MTDGKYELMTCAALAAGLMFCSGCKTLTGDTDRLKGDRVEIPVVEMNGLGPFVSRDVTLEGTSADDTMVPELTKKMVGDIGVQLQFQLQSRGHRIVSAGGALLELSISLQEFRPYKGFEWRSYKATAVVQIPAAEGTRLKRTFVVDGRELEGKKFFVREEMACLPVQTELLKQIGAWLAENLKSKSEKAQ